MRDKKPVTIGEYNGGTKNRGSSPYGWCELLQLPRAHQALLTGAGAGRPGLLDSHHECLCDEITTLS